MPKKNCLICQTVFYKAPTCSWRRWDTIRLYCSLKCKGIASRGTTPHNKAQVAIICKHCEKSFDVSPCRKDTAIFCSRSCSAYYYFSVPEKHPRWKGGISPINQRGRGGRRYSKWRADVLANDDHTCVKCGTTDTKLEADHIKGWVDYPNLRFELSNGQALCIPCHKAKTFARAN